MKFLPIYLFLFLPLTIFGQIPSVLEEVRHESPQYELEQIELYTNAIQNGEDSLKYEYFYWRGMNKMRIKDFKGALSDLNKSIKLRDDNCSAIGLKGTIYSLTENRAKGCKLWIVANEICPGEYADFIEIYCDESWDYDENINGWFLDSTLFEFNIYSGDTSVSPKREWYYRENDYTIYYDSLQTVLCRKNYSQNDTVISYEYYLNGKVKQVSKHFEDIWVYSQKWYSNGNMKTNAQNPNSDSLELIIQYWENGNVSYKYYNKKFVGTDGEFRSYHENGKQWEVGTYSKNMKIGIWVYYNEDGTKSMEETYENGELVHEMKY